MNLFPGSPYGEHTSTVHVLKSLLVRSVLPPQTKVDAGPESDSSLLTALTEILDSVEDDGGTLSPFDALPASEYLNEQRARNPPSVGDTPPPLLTHTPDSPVHIHTFTWTLLSDPLW